MDDDEMMAELEAVLNTLDPAPPSLRDQAIGAASWVAQHSADVDALLAQVEAGELTSSGMRSTTRALNITIAAAGSECSLSIQPTVAGTSLSGIITPPPGEIDVVVPGRPTITTTSDGFGRFEVDVSDALVVALRFIDEAGTTVQTPLVDLL